MSDLLRSSLIVAKLAVAFALFAGFTDAQFRFDSWTTDNGMPQNTVWSIAQTPDGYMWLATGDGLVRFDGTRFKIFNKSNSTNFPTNRLHHLMTDRNGSLWITPENAGIIRFKDGVFRHFTTDNGFPWKDVFHTQTDIDGSLLAYTTQGLMRTRDDGVSFEIERRGNTIGFQVAVSSTGSRWEINIMG